MKKKLKIAITGGIGSGKSLVSGFFEKSGCPVIKSDDLAKELMNDDPVIRKKILKEFGESSYNEQGLNRKYIAEQIFSDPQKAVRMNSIVHPATMKKINAITDQLLTANKIVFVESALIYEAAREDSFDHIILVYADEKIRIKRLLERGGITEEEIQKRIGSQLPDKDKRERADFVIENNTTLADLENRAMFLLNIIRAMLG